MSHAAALMQSQGLADPLSGADAQAAAQELQQLVGCQDLAVYAESVTAQDGVVYFLCQLHGEKLLAILSKDEQAQVVPCPGARQLEGSEAKLGLMPAAREAAVLLRQRLPFTAPRVMGVEKAAGCGDRLGLATPGHLRALRGSGMAAFLAQQSIREMTRTHRTPDEVMDAATLGVFQEGYRDGFGSDADHLKSAEDIDFTLAAGFTMFTIDPGDHVDNAADQDPADELAARFDQLPWEDLESSAADCRERYVGKSFTASDELTLAPTEEDLLRAANKYGKAVAHTVKLYRHLVEVTGDRPFELEVSVDETQTPTSIFEHFFVANELTRLGVSWVSLAPRFIGEFEKGVDYKGDLAEFERTFVQHVAIARHFGPYKISLHSGSDKFSVYPIAARIADDLVHLKTAGTSYLEALRAIGGIDPALFREILSFAFERYPEDRATYHVSADIAKVPHAEALKDDELGSVLDLFDGRQLLHVTFGSVLTWQNEDGSYRFRDRLLHALRSNEEAHYAALEAHIGKHVAPFC